MIDYLIEDAGWLFEAGFMLGVVRALEGIPAPPGTVETYHQQRATYPVSAVIDRFAKHVPDLEDQAAAKIMGRYYLFKGHVSGYTFLREYLDALVAQAGESEYRRSQARNSLQIRYWQCSLLGERRREEFPPSERSSEHARWMAQIGIDPGSLWLGESEHGGFLNADLLLWIQHGQKLVRHDILVVDTSIATPGSRIFHSNLTLGGGLLHMLETDVNYLAEKGIVSHLAIDTGEETGELFTDRLIPYFSAFASKDKESSKLIQAASYAYSFQQFLYRTKLMAPVDQQTVHVVGYSGRGTSSMTIRPNQRGVLEACKTCAEIYKLGKKQDATLEQAERLEKAKQQLYETLQHKIALLFEGGKEFVAQLTTHLPQGEPVEHIEVLQGTFHNTAMPLPSAVLRRSGLNREDLPPERKDKEPSTRDAHAALVTQALASPRRYLFLTGNPGIGKTTAIANYLRDHCHDEGYLFLYASPRKAVNRDIFGKFREAQRGDGEQGRRFYSDRFLGLSTNASLIRKAGGKPAVEYVGSAARIPENKRGVQFLSNIEGEQQLQVHHPPHLHQRVSAVTQDLLEEQALQGAGVLKSICTAIGAALDTTQPNALVAAVAIQSLKRGDIGRDTLVHLREIFSSAYSKRDGQLLPERMRALTATTKHILIMIDEITGDDAGYEFFRRVAEWLDSLHLEYYGIHATIIVSDASITGVEVVRAHFARDQREPDARKIYLTTTSTEQKTVATDPLSLLPFSFDQSDDAYLINSNSYPASALYLHYKVHMPILDLDEQLPPHDRKRLLSTWEAEAPVNQAIVQDVCTLLEQPTTTGQIIVYIQDKRRLREVISAIEKRRHQVDKTFVDRQQYIQIHAESSDSEREYIEDEEKRNRFSVVFMTSSASRGLTFSQARHLLIDVARFNLETNLMEIIQVLYRGRGGEYDEGEKHVTFYLSDRVVAYPQRRDASIREGVIGMLTMLSLLKLCVMTRIAGAVPIRNQLVSLIPIGGKSVSGTGRTYHHDLANFERALRRRLQEIHTKDVVLTTLHQAVSRLLDQAKIIFPSHKESYLQLYETATSEQLEQWMLHDDPIEKAYVLGNLLVVPMGAEETETIHRMAINEAIAPVIQEETERALHTVLAHPQNYPQPICEGASDFKDLFDALRNVERSQQLRHHGVIQQGFYVVPLAIFVAKETIAAYCQEQLEQGQEEVMAKLKAALYRYVREGYPVDTLLPVGNKYNRFPFLVITSQDLEALRAKTFQKGHVLMSREMNLLTLLLSKD